MREVSAICTKLWETRMALYGSHTSLVERWNGGSTKTAGKKYELPLGTIPPLDTHALRQRDSDGTIV